MVNRKASRSASAGMSLKPEYRQDILNSIAPIDHQLWFEAHTENYLVDGGPRLEFLMDVRQHHAISLHGVGASIGNASLPDKEYFRLLKNLVDMVEPTLISEHFAWSRWSGNYFSELLPIPLNLNSLRIMSESIDRYQNAIGRTLLIENPANYVLFDNELSEPEFLTMLLEKTGANLLIDVNNLVVSAKNIEVDLDHYLQSIPIERVKEIHIAGHFIDSAIHPPLTIDGHSTNVDEQVWRLLETVLSLAGPTPVLVERDDSLPPFGELLAETQRAQLLIDAASNKHSNAIAQ